MSGYRTPLGRARGLGSAKHGVGHFIGQRVSALALIFLLLWVVWAAARVARGGFSEAQALLASPVAAALAVLTVVVGFYHAMIGMRVIVEDYIHRPASKAALLILNAFVGWGAMALAVVGILKVTFGGGS